MERLHRSKKNKVVLGVCGGLAEYFRVDPTLVRIICILVSIPGPGFLIYLVAALVMPEDRGFTTAEDTDANLRSEFKSEFYSDDNNWERPAKYNTENNKLVFGTILVGLGILFLVKQIMPTLFDIQYMVPLLLIAIGGIIVFKGRK